MQLNLSFGQRCFALLGLPTAFLLMVSAWVMVERWQTADDLTRLGTLAKAAPMISGVVHELQKERGRSAGYIGSRGKQFSQQLNQQRPVTNAAIEQYRATLEDLDRSAYGPDFPVLLDEVDQRLAQLAEKRRQVSAFSLTVGEMAGYYTGTINKLLESINVVSLAASGDELIRTTRAYDSVLLAKERAGLERAMGANGFGNGKFAPNIHRRFVDLVGQQRAFLATFQAAATPKQKALAESLLNGPIIDEVQRLRDIAISSPFTADLQGVTGPVWFAAITDKIEQMKQLEDYLAADLVSLADQGKTSASLAFWILAASLTMGIVVICAFGWYLGKDVVHAIQDIVAAISKLAAGEKAEIKGGNRKDELGRLCRSLETVYQKGLEAARLRSALDSCSTSILVTNGRADIIYVNPTMQELLAGQMQHLGLSDIKQLMGTNIEALGLSKAEVVDSKTGGQAAREIEAALGDRRLRYVANSIANQSGTYLGTVLECSDLTEDLTIQEEIDSVIQAARQGDFKKTVNCSGVDGVQAKLADGLNQLNGVVGRAVDELAVMLKAMANGDLSKRIDTDYQGRLGDLKDDANGTADRLADIVRQIQEAAGEVGNAASEISAGTEDLSRRTEQAAANIEETAASTEEVAATVRQNAENARTASDVASKADSTAQTGGDVVKQAVTAMAGIEDSAQRITEIIGVIDEIAFQTNLLALNASVEAARAGEAGKGFAVVAQEVRQLAQRSAQAASDIKSLIQDSNGQVKSGVALVGQAGEALSEIVDSVGKVASIVKDISTASQEQALGVQEINNSITSMDEMTQQNSALVEESTAASRALGDQAGRLTQLMDFFKIDKVSHRTASGTAGSQKASGKRTLVEVA
ncbi:MAG: nitrate- and nitrite sensing domain-containing protein [Pseudomonadota bacterium]